MKNRIAILGVALAAGLALAGAVSFSATAQQNQTAGNESPAYLYKLNQKYHDYEDGVLKVRAGAGGPVAPLTWFFPRSGDIKAGETVTWYNPTGVAEPHTVTFLFGGELPTIDGPFAVGNATEFAELPPGSNAEPLSFPGENGTRVVVAANARAWSPTVIDADGNITYLPPNSNYTVTGTEQYINSGFLWPAGLTPPGLPEIESFSLTFESDGSYDYICVIHPWMTGRINVEE